VYLLALLTPFTKHVNGLDYKDGHCPINFFRLYEKIMIIDIS